MAVPPLHLIDKKTALPHSGTNSNRRAGCRSYPGRFLPHFEQIGRPLARGSISTAIVFVRSHADFLLRRIPRRPKGK
jgi:hypothetical protein